MGNHTWYLHPSLIPLCLLDPEVPVELKDQISKDILNMQDYDESNINYDKIDILPIITLEMETFLVSPT